MQVPRLSYALCASEIEDADLLAGDPCEPEHDLDLDSFEVEEESE